MVLSVDIKNYFFNFKERKNVYKFIFYFFSLTGICMNFNTDYRSKNKITHSILFKSAALLFIATSALHLTSCVSSLHEFTPKSKKATIIYMFMCIIYILFRICLYKSCLMLNKMAISVYRISTKIGNSFNIPWWIYVWMCIVLCSIIFTLFQTTFDIYNNNDNIKSILFGYSIENIYLKFIFCFVYSVCYMVLLDMPLQAFDFYYVFICSDISNTFDGFVKLLKDSSKPGYKRLTDVYNDIIEVTEIFDNTLGIFIFISTLFNAFLMYLALTVIINYNNTNFEADGYLMTVNCLLYFISFIVKVESASHVNASSLLCKKQSRKLPVNNYSQICSYIRFTKNCKEISLTIWSFVNIKRNIILGTLGAILTYSLLFDNLIKI